MYSEITKLDHQEEKLASQFECKTVDDLYVGIGCGDISLNKIINYLSDDEPSKQFQAQEAKGSDDTIAVLGVKGLLTVFARCCKPEPGDQIIGYITRGRGVTIHRQDCSNMLRTKDRERIVKVSWGEPGASPKTFPVDFQIKAYDRQGLMGDVYNILNLERINLLNFNLKVTHNLATINLVVEVNDIAQLSRILTKIENLPNVMEANRMKNFKWESDQNPGS